jgi:hypothetical protein
VLQKAGENHGNTCGPPPGKNKIFMLNVSLGRIITTNSWRRFVNLIVIYTKKKPKNINT